MGSQASGPREGCDVGDPSAAGRTLPWRGDRALETGVMCASKRTFLVREALNWQQEEERNLQEDLTKSGLSPYYGSGDT